jgi:hypothetical protein
MEPLIDVFRKMDIPLSLSTTMSGLPSPSRSLIAIELPFRPTLKATLGPKSPPVR